MTLAEQFEQIDDLIPSNVPFGVSAENLRENLKQIATQLYGVAESVVNTTQFNTLSDAVAKTSLANMWVSATSAGQATGTGDDTFFIRNSILTAGGRGVWFPAKTYRVSQNISLPDNCHVQFAKGSIIEVTANFPATDSGGNSTRYVFLAGHNSLIEGATIDGKGFDVGGVLLLQKDGVTIRDCTIKNWTGIGFGIVVIGGRNNRVLNNTLTDGEHGINAFRSTNLLISGNITNRNFSGIYVVACTQTMICFNITLNNVDVGIDCEHGKGAQVYCNYSARSGNGEYAIFSGGPENAGEGTMNGIIFKGNVAVRKSTYVTHLDVNGNEVTAACDPLKGACDFASIGSGAYNCGFEYNNLYVEFGYAFTHWQSPDKNGRSVYFRHNTVVTKSGGKFHRALNSDGLEHSHNSYSDAGGGEGTQNELRDGHGMICEENTYRYALPKTSLAALLVNTSESTFMTTWPIVRRNKFYNCGALGMRIDLFNHSAASVEVIDNDMGHAYSSNGGIDIFQAAGNVRLRNQKLRIGLPDGATNLSTAVTALSRSGELKATGDISYGRGGYNGATAIVHYLAGSSIGIMPLITASGLTFSVSNKTLTLGNTTGVPCAAMLDLTVNSL